jgi:GT2 family glycosyltransferase
MKVVLTGKNEGVGAGYNAGFELVDTRFCVTLNNDMLIYEVDWLQKLYAPFVIPQIAQVGLHGSPCWLDPFGMGHLLEEAVAYFQRPVDADYVESSCMMVRTEAVRQCGDFLFDPAYRFAYCEDSDLSLRLRSEGYSIAHVPVNVEHLGHVTLGAETFSEAKSHYWPNHNLLRSRWANYLRTKSFA